MEDKKYLIDACVDIPTENDYRFEDMEFADGDVIKKRPENTTVFNQWQTPMCTYYAAMHVSNAQNILEYASVWETYTEIDPWKFFIDNRPHSVQDRAMQMRELGFILWYTTISNNRADKLGDIKKAIDNGLFISTGSNNGDWTKTKKTKIYTLRTDWKIVWHAWDMVSYDDNTKLIKCKNSRWPGRCDKWYFYLRYEDVYKVYSCLAFIDKSNTEALLRAKNKSKARLLVDSAKSLYNDADEETKKFLESIQLGKRFTEKYWL